jgi:hypothetical protein
MDADTRGVLQSYIEKEVPTYGHKLTDDEFTPILLMVVGVKLDRLMAMLEEKGLDR